MVFKLNCNKTVDVFISKLCNLTQNQIIANQFNSNHVNLNENNTLGSVHKYFGGVGWAIENFRHQTFLTPLFKPPKLFEPPLNKC